MVALSLAACSNDTPAEPSDPAPSTGVSDLVTPAPASPVPSPSYTVADEAPAALEEAIRTDLTSRGADAESVQVVEARRITWNDGSLGCPQPGVQYTHALVDGWQIIVSAGEKTYDYRFGGDAVPLLCEMPTLTTSEAPNPKDT